MSNPDTDCIRHALSGKIGERLDCLEIFAEIGSTNSYLLAEPGPPPGAIRAALAEHQTSGRGRFDRRWISPPLSGLCMSVAYTFGQTPAQLPGLTLAAGIAIVNALRQLSIDGVSLKWPNDLVAEDSKLGGILTEVRQHHARGTTVVIGTGINVTLPAASLKRLARESDGGVIDVASMVENPPSHSALAAAVIEQLFDMFSRFEVHGFAPYHKTWPQYDWLHGRRISVESAQGLLSGVAEGIDRDGALLIRTKGGRKRILSGSIALSAHAAARA